jgi:hypothetical protein
VDVRFYLDEDLAHGARLKAIRAASIDVVSAREAGMLRRSDDDQLRYATDASRLILTHNQRDFARIHREWIRDGGHHGGICIMVKELDYGPGEIVRRLDLLAEVFRRTGTRDQLLFLSNFS